MTESSRRFSESQRAAIYLAHGGKCAWCGAELAPGWHADHRHPFSRGGTTDVTNGQALCPDCNIRKGASVDVLRKWQINAMRDFLTWLRELERSPHGLGFLVEATPGAGKTRFAINAIHELIQAGRIQQVVVVVPTSRLETQWHKVCAKFGIKLDPHWHGSIGKLAGDLHGCVVTYGEVPNQVLNFRLLVSARPTLVILDEVHHLSDDEKKSWGPAIKSAFGASAVKLLLSGTPFRSDDGAIPFVRYVDGVGAPDFRYGYGEALSDKIVRAVFFPRRGGRMEWDDTRGKRREHTFEEEISKQASRHRLRTAIQADGDWLPAVLAQADEQLTMLRTTDPRAGGIVFCADQGHARAVTTALRAMGRVAVLVISEDADSDVRVEAFDKSSDPWIVTVRKVSEGVDIPRLRVGVYASPWTTEMFFRQVVGRIIRRPEDDDDPTAWLFIPDDPELRHHAAEIAETRDTVLGIDEEPTDPPRGPGEGPSSQFMPIASSPATDAGLTTASGVLLTPAELLHAETVKLMDPTTTAIPTPVLALALRNAGIAPPPGESPSELFPEPKTGENWLADKKRAKNRNNMRVAQIVNAYGKGYDEVNAVLNRAVGVSTVNQASQEQLEKRYQFASEWLRSGEAPAVERW